MKLFDVECDGKYIAKAKVVAADRDTAIREVKEQVAKYISDFVSVSIVDVRVKLNACTWTAVETRPGIVKLDWDVKKRAQEQKVLQGALGRAVRTFAAAE